VERNVGFGEETNDGNAMRGKSMLEGANHFGLGGCGRFTEQLFQELDVIQLRRLAVVKVNEAMSSQSGERGVGIHNSEFPGRRPTS
jgi:hypothetical protein